MFVFRAPSMAAVFDSTDTVPTLRTDLKVTDKVHGTGENTVVVSDPATGKQLTMRGFELSLARMLNGARTAGQVIDKAKAIGLPITLEALTRFVKQLRTQGFLVEKGTAPVEAVTTWQHRNEWPEDKRAKYQAALREARENQLTEAKQHLEGLKQDAFESTDVAELSAWVDERIKGPGDGRALPTFAEIFSSVERSWFEEGDLQSEQNEKAPEPPPAHSGDLPVARTEPERRRRKVWPWLLAMIVLAGAAVAALVPFPNRATGSFVLEPQASVAVTAAQPGMVGSVDATEGQWVAAGDVLFHYDTRDAQQKLAAAEAKIAELQQKLDDLTKTLADPSKQLADAQAEQQAAQTALDEAQAAHKRHDAAAAQAKVKKATKKIETAQAALTKARGVAEKAAGITQEELETQLTAATADRDAQKALSELPPLAAPAAGVVAKLAIKHGDAVKPGAPVCQLDDTRALVVRIHSDDANVLREARSASVSADAVHFEVKIDKVENGEASGQIDNPDRKIPAGTRGEISIEGERKTLFARWF
jgi:multidrug resistance efflux pump